MTANEYLEWLHGNFPLATDDQIDEVLVYYPTVSGNNRGQAATALGDYMFVCFDRRVVRATTPIVPTYVYHFNHTLGCGIQTYGVYHSSELAFVFGTPGCSPVTQDELDLSAKMQKFWANFARTGDPNKGDTQNKMKRRVTVGADASWPLYDATDDTGMLLDLGDLVTESHRSQAYCDFWDSFPF